MAAPELQRVHQQLAEKSAQLAEVVDELVYMESRLQAATEATGAVAATANEAFTLAANAVNAGAAHALAVAQRIASGHVEPQVRHHRRVALPGAAGRLPAAEIACPACNPPRRPGPDGRQRPLTPLCRSLSIAECS